MASRHAVRAQPGPPHRGLTGAFGRALLFYGAFVVVAIGGAIAVGYVLGGAHLRSEEKAWAQAGLSFDDMLRRWPTRSDSGGAVTLDRLARPLGVRLILAEGETKQIDDGALLDAINTFMGGLVREDSHCSAVPDAARRFLDAHRTEMAAVVAHLRSDAEIAWRTDLTAGLSGPIPGLLGQRQLNNLLLLEALRRSARGDASGAEEALDAAWHQGEVLAARADLISVLIAMALSGQQAAVLRCQPEAAQAWEVRLQQRTFRRPAIDRLQAEAYGDVQLGRQGRGVADLEGGPLDQAPGAQLVRALTIPYVRLSCAATSGQLRRAREMALATDYCGSPADDLDRRFAAGIPRWDFISPIAVPGLLHVPATGTATDLEAEMSANVLRLRRRLRQGELAHGSPFSVPSGVCPGLVWRLARQEDARWSVYAEPPPAVKRGRAPWQYTLGTGFPRR